MIVTFDKRYLKELYETGTTSEKKYRFQPDIAKRYKRCISYLIRVSRKEELYRFNSLNFEAFHGDKSGLYSIRVNDKYRIEFSLDEDAEKPMLTVCNIVELNNHYK